MPGIIGNHTGTPAREWEVRELSLGAHLSSTAPAAMITTLAGSREQLKMFVWQHIWTGLHTCVKGKLSCWNKKVCSCPLWCLLCFVLCCLDFPVKSSLYFFIHISSILTSLWGGLCLLFTVFFLVLPKSSSSHFVAIFGIVYSSDHTLTSGISFPFSSILFLGHLGPQL